MIHFILRRKCQFIGWYCTSDMTSCTTICVFVTFHLENALTDLSINKLCLWPKSYYGAKHQLPGSYGKKKNTYIHTYTQTQTNRHTDKADHSIDAHFVRATIINTSSTKQILDKCSHIHAWTKLQIYFQHMFTSTFSIFGDGFWQL